MNDANTEAKVTEVIEGPTPDEAAVALIVELTGEPAESVALMISLERYGYGDVLPPPADGDAPPAAIPAPVELGHTPDPIPEGVDIQQHGELGPVIADPSHDFSTQQK